MPAFKRATPEQAKEVEQRIKSAKEFSAWFKGNGRDVKRTRAFYGGRIRGLEDLHEVITGKRPLTQDDVFHFQNIYKSNVFGLRAAINDELTEGFKFREAVKRLKEAEADLKKERTEFTRGLIRSLKFKKELAERDLGIATKAIKDARGEIADTLGDLELLGLKPPKDKLTDPVSPDRRPPSGPTKSIPPFLLTRELVDNKLQLDDLRGDTGKDAVALRAELTKRQQDLENEYNSRPSYYQHKDARAAAELELKELFDRLGLADIGVKLRLGDDFRANEAGYYRETTAEKLIHLAYNQERSVNYLRAVLYHESVHALATRFTDAEIKTLAPFADVWIEKFSIVDRYSASYSTLSKERRLSAMREEAIAEAFSLWASDQDRIERGLRPYNLAHDFFENKNPKAEEMVLGLFRKVRAKLLELRDALIAEGMTTPEEVFARIRSGEVAARPPTRKKRSMGERNPIFNIGHDAVGTKYYIGDSPDIGRGQRAVNRAPVYLDSMFRGMQKEGVGPVEYIVSANDNRLDGRAAVVRGRAIYIRNDIQASEIAAARMWGLGQWLMESQKLPDTFETMPFASAWSEYLVNAASLDTADRAAYLAIQRAVDKSPRFAKYIADLQKTMDEIVVMAPAEATRMQWEGKRVDPRLSFSFDLPRRIIRNLQQTILDSNRPFKDIDELNQAQGLPGFSYAAADAVRNASRMYSRFITKGAWEYELKASGEYLAKPIKGARGLEEVLDPIYMNDDIDGFFDYWTAKAVLETREQGREYTISESDARATIADLEATGKTALYDKVLAEFYEDVDKPFKKMMVSSGIVSQNQIDGWAREFWLPFFKQYDNQPRAWSRPLKGGGIHRLQDPAESLSLRYHAEIQLMAENMAKRTLAKQVEGHEQVLTLLGDIDSVRIGLGPGKDEILGDIIAAYPEDSRGLGFAALLEDMPNANLVLEAAMANRNKPNWMVVLEDGKGKVYEVKDKGVLAALQAFRPAQRGKIVSALNKLRVAYQSLTTYTPNFAVAGYLKDVIQSATIAEKGRRPSFIQGLKGSIKLDEAFDDSLMYGSSGTGIFLTEQGTFRKTWQKAPPSSIARIRKRPYEGAVAVLRGYNRVHQTLEQSNRLGTYKTEKDAGTASLQAAAQARFIHGNYAQRGTSPVANAILDILPYARAGIIGFDAWGQRAIGSQPLSGRLRVESRRKDIARVATTTAALAIPIALLQIVQRDNVIEAQRSAEDRIRYPFQFYVKLKEVPEGLTAEEAINGGYYAIPSIRSAYEVGAISGALANLLTEFAKDNPRYGEVLTAAIKEFIPIGSRPGGAPGALRDYLQNENFFGGPLVPHSQFDERGNPIPPWLQSADRTFLTALQRSTGLSPGHIGFAESAVESLTGAMGRYVLDSVDTIYRLSSGIGTSDLPKSNLLILREPERVRFQYQTELREMSENYAQTQSVASKISLSKAALSGQSDKSIKYLNENISHLVFGRLTAPLAKLGSYERTLDELQFGPNRISQEDYTERKETIEELRGRLHRAIVFAQRDIDAAFKGDKQAETRYRKLLQVLGLDKSDR